MENDNDIVITGISGRFPECNNVEEFINALFEGKDLLTVDDRRFPAGMWNTPERMGKIPEPHKFDAAFFGIHPKLSNFMDPRHKIILETVYESIIDAGYNPAELRGSKTGVYSGMEHFTSMDEVRNYKSQGYANLGFAQALSSNRVSYTFDFRGPSLTLDTACSSSLYALSVAVKDMNLGEIDSAIINGAQLITHPHESLEFNNLNMLAADGKCKVFNVNRDGYARAEAIVTIFLQRRSKARRIYSQIIGVKTSSDGYKPEGITYPNASQQFQLMQSLYDEIKLNPKDITYIEAHGTGTTAGDIEECQGLATMFHNVTKPLPIGSVKSNMGHSECASGICALIKVLAIMEKKAIPASLHCEFLDQTLPGIKEGIFKIVNKTEPWEEGIIALNCFGFGGANAHVVLKPHNKTKSIPKSSNQHRLVQVSGRSREAVEKFLDEIESNRDEGLLTLTDEIHKINIEGHQYRGYTVLNNMDTRTREIQKYDKARPIWFIYSGMGSQWVGMGKDLLKIPAFKSTFLRSAKALEPYNIDLLDIVTSDSPIIFDNITNCFAAIGAVQVALTDVLLKFGIKPDGIAGHSLGEVCCCYADGLVTAEEATLLAFARGYACYNATSLPEGQMAAIGLSKTEVVKLLPNDIYIACQNGSNSVTISGPKVSVIHFVNQLQSKNIFAKLVKSADIAFHTKYISDAGKFLYDFVKRILKDPKPRTKRWISSSISPEKSNEQWTQYNTAEYHTNNFCNTVLFDQVYEHIPDNAIVIEVAPHGLLQPILKRELGSDATYISLANRSSADNELFLLSAIGKIFNAGGQPQLRNWYDELQFPVSSGTKCLSPMVHWNHSEDWLSHFYHHKDYFGSTVKVNLGDEEYSYLVGHEIDGRVLMPATGYLELVWKVLSSLLLKNIENLPVIFEDVKFKRATVLSQNEEVTFLVTIMKQSGYFEIFEGGSVVVTGIIKVPKDVSKEFHEVIPPQHAKNQYLLMCEDDIYKECHLRRYNYNGIFKGLIECDVGGTRGRVAWKGKWDSFLDSMIHLMIIEGTKRDLRLPTALRRLVIDPEMHLKMIGEKTNIDVFYNKNVQVIQSGAIQIIGVETSKAPRRVQVSSPPNLETYKFVPYISPATLDLERALTIALQIVIQNLDGTIKKMVIYEKEKLDKISDIVKEVLNREPLLSFDYYTDNSLPNYDLVLLNENWDKVPEPKANFYLYVGNADSDKFQDTETLFEASTADNIKIVLLKTILTIPDKYAVIKVTSTDFDWLEKIKIYSESDDRRTIYLYSCNENNNGLLGLVKCLITEASHLSFKAVIITQDGTQTFSMENPFHRNQLKKGLNFNVLNDGIWGTYVHLPLEPIDAKKCSQASVDIGTVGDLSTLAWFQTPQEPKNKEIVNVHYGSLNFKDIMMATGRISSENNYPTPVVPAVEIGLEYSGVTATGRRVMGLLPYRSISLQACLDTDFSWEVPSKWSLEDAATVPCVYATCYYALFVRGGIEPGSSILIHGGTGGVGLAAINIALGLNCQIFTTVGTQEKKNWLKETFPEIPEENIGNSRNQSFEYLVMERTQGKGVDFVLNSLAEDLFQASLRCVARRGCFLEIGKFDMMNSAMINSKLFLKNCTFHGVLLDDFFNDSSKTKRKINKLLEEGISSGVVKPLPRHVFTETQLETAFRFLASGKHKGKVMIQIRPNETPLERTIMANPALHFDPGKSYIIVGGLGGFGLELADWMIKKGATKILLNSRRDISNGYQSYCFKKWSEYKHIVVKVNLDDTTNAIGAERCVKMAEELGGRLGGVFSLALVLRDNLIVNQTKQTFQEVFDSKIVSVQNLDRVTRKLGINLDYFVAFSSIACGRGNNGQSNYGMANSAIEALCEKRMKDGLPALAVQWGPIGDVGAITRINTIGMMLQYIKLQPITSCLSCLEQFMLQSSPIVSSFIVADSISKSESAGTKKPVALAVTHILGLKDFESVNKDTTLAQLGLDSLMLSEIKQTLYRNYQIDMSNEDIRNLTFTKLITMSQNNNNQVEEPSAVKVETLNYISPKETLVKINSNSNNQKVLFLVHGIEGTTNFLEPLASQLNRTTYGIQCSLNLTFESVKDLALAYMRELKKTHQGPYVISGYSFGCAVAFEIGVELEKLGDKVELVLIDGSPNFVRQSLSSEYQNRGQSEEKCLNSILNTFTANFPDVPREEARKTLAATSDIEIKFKKLAQLISDKTSLEPEIVARSAKQFYKRCVSGFNYQPNDIFNGKITLIRTEDNTILDSEDYDLQTVCKEKVQVFKIGGTHRSMLTGEWLNNICSILNKLI